MQELEAEDCGNDRYRTETENGAKTKLFFEWARDGHDEFVRKKKDPDIGYYVEEGCDFIVNEVNEMRW